MNHLPIFKETRTAKVSLLVILVGTIFWLGGINIRAVIGNDILVMGTLDFEPNINPLVERSVFGLISKSSIVIFISYIVVWIAGITFLTTTRLRLKQNGWLMMSAILFYIFTPVEIYTLMLDGRMIYQDLFTQGELVEFRKLLIHRIAALSGVPIIAQFCYYTIIGLVVFQPLKRYDT